MKLTFSSYLSNGVWPNGIHPHDVQRLAAWSVLGLELPSDLEARVEFVPDGYFISTVETAYGTTGHGMVWGEAFSEREMIVRLPGGWTGMPKALPQDWIEICAAVFLHEAVHILQFVAKKEAEKTEPSAVTASARVPSAPPTIYSESEMWELEIRADLIVAGRLKEIHAAERMYEDQALKAGQDRLDEWRDLASSTRDAIRTGRLEQSRAIWQ